VGRNGGERVVCALAPLPDAATLLKQSSQTTKSAHLAVSVSGKIKASTTGADVTQPSVFHSVVEPRFHWHSCTYTEQVDRAEGERYVGPRAVRAFDDGGENNRSRIAILHHGFSMTTQVLAAQIRRRRATGHRSDGMRQCRPQNDQ